MSVEMDLPEQIEPSNTATAAPADPAKEAAKESATAALESADGSIPLGKEITIVLTCDVTDAVVDFHGHRGDTLTAQQDEDGEIWVEIGDQVLNIGPGECEIVVADQEQTAATVAVADDQPSKPTQLHVSPPAAAKQTTEPQPQHPQQQVKPAATAEPVADDRRAKYFRDVAIIQESIGAVAIDRSEAKREIEAQKKIVKECDDQIDDLAEKLKGMLDCWESSSQQQQQTNPATSVAAGGAATGNACGCGDASADRAATDITQPEPASEPERSPDPTPQKFEDQAKAVESSMSDHARYEAVLRTAQLSSLIVDAAVKGIGAKMLERMADDGIKTVWDYEFRKQQVGLGKAEWTKGLGDGKREGIDAAVDEWISSHRADWSTDPIQQANDAVEQRQDEQRAAEVAESQPSQPATTTAQQQRPLFTSEIDDL